MSRTRALNVSSRLPTGPRSLCPAACGSYQMDDSIGSRVNETNSETATANAMVMPNW